MTSKIRTLLGRRQKVTKATRTTKNTVFLRVMWLRGSGNSK
jgi:hypothetical protein